MLPVVYAQMHTEGLTSVMCLIAVGMASRFTAKGALPPTHKKILESVCNMYTKSL